MKNEIRLLVLWFLIGSACQPALNNPGENLTESPSEIGSPSPVPATQSPPATPIPPSSEGWIAFLNKNNLWLIHPDGSGLTQITENTLLKDSQATSIFQLAWSNDGSKLAYSQQQARVIRIFIYDPVLESMESFVYESGGGFDWSGNGRQIIYDAPPEWFNPLQNNGIWLINLENLKKRRIVPPTNEISGMVDPQWSADGTRVIFSLLTSSSPGFGIADFAGRAAFILPFPGLIGCEWSPVELVIACFQEFPRGSAGNVGYQIFLFDDTTHETSEIPLPGTISSPELEWSPDGSQLAIGYYHQNLSWTDLYSFGTGEMQRLAQGIVTDWYPDGKWLTVTQQRSDNVSTISIVSVPSGDSFTVTEGTSPKLQP